tara:strand:- start:27 stop:425 length:399 start_codon:yes stop_codon:yes gene_type:complete
MQVEIDSPFDDEKQQIGIDFDGVIHKCSKGYHDGTIYDDPIEGSLEAIQNISTKFTIIIYSAKARSDRPLVNNKTGIELIWEWLEKHGFKEYVKEVTAEKPRAFCYIDDRAIRFTDWQQTREILKNYLVLTP